MFLRKFYSIVPLCLLATACLEANSEQETLTVSIKPLFYSAAHHPSGSLALQGSTACFEVVMVRPEGQDGIYLLERCYDVAIKGASKTEGDCVVLDALGAVEVDFTPRADCSYVEDMVDLPADVFRLEVVPIDGLRAGLEWYGELFAAHFLNFYEPAPTGWIPAADEPLLLVPDVEVVFPINVINAAGERVAWELSQGRVLEARDGGAPRELSPLEDQDSLWPVSIKAGQRSTISLALAGVEMPVAEVVATPADQAASLEIVAGHLEGPYAARAVVRDGEGRVIYGAPVEWIVVEGEVMLAPVEEVQLPPEYTMIGDRCKPPPAAAETRRVVVRARLGELVDEVEMEWVAMPLEEPSDTPFEADPLCQKGVGSEESGLGDRGCGCVSDLRGGRDGWPWLLVFGVAVGRRRRRRVL